MARVRLGVVGCGAIAQIQHLPNLATLQEEFEVVAVCDRSPALARAVAEEFYVLHHFSDYRDLLAADVDAVLLCHADPKTEVAIAAFQAGKHTFIEKPLCYSLKEADAIIDAARSSGKAGLMGYMKVYDPAFELARREVEEMENIRFVQIDHFHTDNAHHLAQFRLQRFDDVPERAIEETRKARQAAARQAIGPAPPAVETAFFHLAGSMIHDLYGLRFMVGQPLTVIGSEIWNEGWGITTTLACPDGSRCAATWVELRRVRDFRETLEVCGDDRRVLLSYPTGFARGILSTVTVQGLDDEGNPVCRQPAVSWENPFTCELRHFHECITRGALPRTPVEDARGDVALIIDIVRAYLDGGYSLQSR